MYDDSLNFVGYLRRYRGVCMGPGITGFFRELTTSSSLSLWKSSTWTGPVVSVVFHVDGDERERVVSYMLEGFPSEMGLVVRTVERRNCSRENCRFEMEVYDIEGQGMVEFFGVEFILVARRGWTEGLFLERWVSRYGLVFGSGYELVDLHPHAIADGVGVVYWPKVVSESSGDMVRVLRSVGDIVSCRYMVSDMDTMMSDREYIQVLGVQFVVRRYG